jgi:dimethylargininase
VPTDDRYPDCVFIEDTAVIIGSTAVITRTAAPSRRGEAEPVARALDRYLPLARIKAPGALDGGDVLTTRSRIYVGLSERTNQEAIDQLEPIAADQGLEVVAVSVLDGLHLKSVVLPVDEEAVVVTPRAVEEAALDGLTVIYEHEMERHRFSALPLRDGRLLVTAGARNTISILEGLGHDVVPIDVSQIQLADGGLTCMSILF